MTPLYKGVKGALIKGVAMKTKHIKLKTKGNTDIIDITPQLKDLTRQEKLKDAILFLGVIGSTAAITTMEYEPGQVKDFGRLLEELIPYRGGWAHNSTWNDDNGHSHLRSSFLKTSLFISVTNAKLDLGTWQQVVLLDFDTRPRDRDIVVKIIT